MSSRFHARGVTLIELIAFIIIIGVLVSGLIGGFSTTLRGSGTPKQMTQALQLAQERMELIRAQKDRLGFACFDAALYDPCNPPAPAAGTCPALSATSTHPSCNSSMGYTVTSALDDNSVAPVSGCMGGDVNYKCITVTVTDPTGTKFAELKAAVANY